MHSTGSARGNINPYRAMRRDNGSDSLDSILQSLKAATSNGSSQSFSSEQWDQLQSALEQYSEEWNILTARTFLEWVNGQVGQDRSNEHAARSLNLLSVVLNDQWTLDLVYSLSCPFKGQKPPFHYLGKLARDPGRPLVQSASCACLAALWRALSQFDSLTSTCAVPFMGENMQCAWWIGSLEDDLDTLAWKEDYWSKVYQWCLDQWLRKDPDIDSEHKYEKRNHEQSLMDREKSKYTAAILLGQFLFEDSTSSWLHAMSEEKWWALTERLIEQSQRLLDPNMPMTSFARLALVSVHLLSIMDRKSGREMPAAYEKLLSGTGGLVVVMMHSIVNATAEGVPRWAKDGTDFIRPILHEWSKGGSLLNFWELEARSESARSFVKDVTERIRDGALFQAVKLSNYLWIMRETPALCQNVINDLIPKHQWTDLFGSLVSYMLNQKIVHNILTAACVLRQLQCLFPNRRLDLTESTNKGHLIVKKLAETASEAIQTSNDTPLLFVLLDVLSTMIEDHYEMYPSVGVLVEDIVGILSSTDSLRTSRNMTMIDADTTMDSAESTPPAHNLSKLDESKILLEDESDESIETEVKYALEPCIRLSAAALLLSALQLSTDCCSREFQVKASKVLSEFVSTDSVLIPVQQRRRVSSGVFWRRANMLRQLASLRQETYFFDIMFGLESSLTRTFDSSITETTRLRHKIQWLEQREKHLSEENAILLSRLQAQTSTAQRERSVLHRKLVNESRQTLQAEISQRVELQRQTNELRTTVKELGDQLSTAEAENKSLHESETQLKGELGEKLEIVKNLQESIAGLEEDRNRNRERVEELTKEVNIANETIDGLKKREKQLRDQVSQNEQDLDSLEASRAQMHANLESLFGDMVSLAHAYELKEKEVSSGQEIKESTIEKLEKDLEKERQRRKDLEDKFRQVEYENEALSRKCARMRERLEEERTKNQRSQAQASQASSRRGDGSKSYIQQLQLTTSRNISTSSSRYGKENQPRSSKIR